MHGPPRSLPLHTTGVAKDEKRDRWRRCGEDAPERHGEPASARNRAVSVITLVRETVSAHNRWGKARNRPVRRVAACHPQRAVIGMAAVVAHLGSDVTERAHRRASLVARDTQDHVGWRSASRWHRLYFRPLPHQHGALRPGVGDGRTGTGTGRGGGARGRAWAWLPTLSS